MKAIKAKYAFHGVHVPDKKALASGKAIENAPEQDVLNISLSQCLGKPSIPCVAVGDKVKQGQTIAEAGGFIGAKIHAPVSGTVKSVSGAIVIENDKLYETAYLPPLEDPTPEEIKQRVGEAGIVGMGGAGFPTFVKLNPQDKVDTLVLNGAECEPYLTCDHRIMIEKTSEIAEGIALLKKALGVEKVFLGIEANKPDAIMAFEAYDFIQPVILKKQYPVGSEKHLIYACTGRKVAPGKLPASAGCIVQNVATCLAIYEAVKLGKPLFERVLTVSGEAVTETKNYLVKIGTPLSALVENNLTEEVAKIVCGGPMTGAALKDLERTVTKTTGGVVAMTEEATDTDTPTACIACGKCADVCPMNLMPMNTAFYTAAGEYDMANKMGGVMNCIECGACAYICPARRPLIQSIRKAKAEIRKGGQK